MNPIAWWLLGGLAVAGTVAVVVSSKDDSGSATPGPITDPEAYFSQVNKQAESVKANIAARQDESDARVASWKRAAKYIPVIGDYAGYLIDLGNWLGKVLGSNYAEQNSPEDLDRASKAIQAYIENGYVPPKPIFTAKDGAKGYWMELEASLVGAKADASLTAMGNLTIEYSSHPAMIHAISEAALGNGSLKHVGWYGAPPVLRGAESIMAGIVVSMYSGTDYESVMRYAIDLIPTMSLGAAFAATLKAASNGAIVKPILMVVVAGAFSPFDRT